MTQDERNLYNLGKIAGMKETRAFVLNQVRQGEESKTYERLLKELLAVNELNFIQVEAPTDPQGTPEEALEIARMETAAWRTEFARILMTCAQLEIIKEYALAVVIPVGTLDYRDSRLQNLREVLGLPPR